jgi:hypothetical protein
MMVQRNGLMDILAIEAEADELRLELRELALKQSEIAVLWSESRVPTDQATRNQLKYDMDEVKLDLTKAENRLREAKRQGRMDMLDSLCFICEREGHGEYIAEAKNLSEVE